MDGWFIGFTNDVTVAVWVGYDNADRKCRSLGSSETGASVALPIFEPIVEAVWARKIAPKAPLSGPSPEAQPQLVDLPIDYASGDRLRGSRGFVEHFRRGPDDQVHDTQYQLVSGHSSDNERSGKHSESSVRAVKPGEGYRWARARRNNTQQAEGRGSRTRVRLATILKLAATIIIGSSQSAAGTRVIFLATIIREVARRSLFPLRRSPAFRAPLHRAKL